MSESVNGILKKIISSFFEHNPKVKSRKFDRNGIKIYKFEMFPVNGELECEILTELPLFKRKFGDKEILNNTNVKLYDKNGLIDEQYIHYTNISVPYPTLRRFALNIKRSIEIFNFLNY